MLRRVLTRVVLILAGLAVGVAALLVVELGLRAAGIGAGGPRYDPFAGFSSTVPVFETAVRDDGVRIFRTSPKRRVPVPQEFLAEKPPGGFRAFVVGESSAAGVPYPATHAFSAFLQRRLRAELPGVPVEVVNAAISGYASRRILAVVRELARYEPDLLIVYAGHNEFAERKYYAHLIDMNPALFRLWELLAQTRVYALASRAFGDPTGKKPQFDFSDLNNAYEMFAVADERLEGVYPTPRELEWGERHYRFNVTEMIAAMDAVGARTMLLTLSQNFADWPPAASSHRPDLTPEELAAFDEALREGRARAARGDCAGALERYRAAREIDDTYALLLYEIATCERALGDLAAARQDYRLASDLDRVPHGAPTRFNDVLREIARERGALLVEVDRVLEERSPGGIVGDNFFADFCHPNLAANAAIAEAVAVVLRDAGIPRPAAQWAAPYVEPDFATLYAADPSLRTQEHLVRAAACILARRPACAQADIDAVLAMEPDNAFAHQLRRGLESQRAQTDGRS